MSVENAPGFGAISRGRASMKAIETLAAIRAAARSFATDEELGLLRQFSGWGPMKDVFAPKDEAWGQMAERLAELLSPDDIETGMQGTYNAFYTPKDVTAAMWGLLEALGFGGGQVAELGCGTGAFMETAPDNVRVVGVERDPTAAAMAELLNPRHQVIGRPLQEVTLPGTFGAVIGNIPFGDVRVFDPSVPEDSQVNRSLHNYFIWRALMALAPGGVAVLLTSRFTMDASDWEVRKELGDLADFVGAIRLPGGGLEGGTEVVADILVLRRKVPGELTQGHNWIEVDRERIDANNPVNGFWGERPGLVLGTMRKGETQQYGRGVLVDPLPGESAADGIRRVTPALAEEARGLRLPWVAPVDVAEFDAEAADVISREGWLENSFHLVGGVVKVVVDGVAQPLPNPSKELRALIGLRDMAENLVGVEANHAVSDSEVDKLRRPLARAYATYVKQFGYLNRSTVKPDGFDEDGTPLFKRHNPSMGGFRHDPGSALVFALEIWDDDTMAATPAPLLSARQNRPLVRPEFTDDPRVALGWSLNYTGGVDLDYIAARLNLPDGADEDALAEMLGDAVFQEPGYERWITAEEYLSGDVRAKLKAAETAAIVEKRYQRNVDALAAVVPKWLGPGEIKALLSAPWIPASDIADFLKDLLGGGAKVRHLTQSNRWEIEGGFRNTTKACEEWGTPDVDGYKLVELALNGKSPEVFRRVSRDKRVKDDALSLQAAEMQQRIKERFSQWVWEDGFRCERLVTFYNTNFNCLVTRKFNGDHITVDGLAPHWADKLYPHQREFIARVLATPATLCGHPVGAGKTATMTCAAMKLSQVGLVDKPMLVVPNHLLGQADAAARQMFPGARILSSALDSKSGRSKGKGAGAGATSVRTRRAFVARVSTQPWDLIIITQSAFDRMPVNPATESAYLELQRRALRTSIIESSSEDGEMKGRQVKAMAKRLDTLEARIKELRTYKHGTDGGVTFEQMGVRWIGIDEAHNYANLAVPCYNEGFSISPSKRATHLDMILRWLAGQGSGRYAALFTGTPVKNTMLQLYVMQQYLMPEYLDSIGLGSADAWVSTYVEMETKVGVTVNGGSFEMQTRPSRFVNAPELRVLFSMVADIRTAEQLGLKRPASAERVVKVEPTTAQQAYAAVLVERAAGLKGVRFPGKGADNMLKVCNDGRWMATDPCLVGLHDYDPSKLHAVAEEMIKLWREHPDELQIGFCDVGTPNADKGDQSYGRLRQLLVDMGMPRERIRFVHSAGSMEEKNALFKACNAGRVSVILGSTEKLGTGTNIQERVVAMHHIDAPYTPAGVEQRDGRGLRPGNRNELVHNIRYVTARTFDAYLWQMLVRKLTFISQLMSGNLDREIEDCQSEQLMSFSAVQASATDQPLLLERSEVEVNVNRLRTMQAGHRQMQQRQRQHIPLLRAKIAEKEAERKAWAAVAAAEVPELDEEAAKALGDRLKESMDNYRRYTDPIKVGGLEVTFSYWLTPASEQREPMMRVDGGDGWITDKLYSSYKAETLVSRLMKMVAKADLALGPYDDLIAGFSGELEQKEALLEQGFDHQDELTAALARLDQIDAELKREAVKHDLGEDAIAGERDLHALQITTDNANDRLCRGTCSCGEWWTATVEGQTLVKTEHAIHREEVRLIAELENGAVVDLGSRRVPDTIPESVIASVAAATAEVPDVVKAAEQLAGLGIGDVPDETTGTVEVEAGDMVVADPAAAYTALNRVVNPEPDPFAAMDDILGGLLDAPAAEPEPDPFAAMDDILGALVSDYQAEMDRKLADTFALLGL